MALRPATFFVSFIARTSAYANGNRLDLVGPSVYAPHSRGSVQLDPGNPKGGSLVDFNLLADPRDFERLLKGAEFARALLQDERVRAVTFEAFVLPPNPPVRLLNQPGPSAALLNHAIAAMVALPEPARRAALRRVLAPGKLLSDISSEARHRRCGAGRRHADVPSGVHLRHGASGRSASTRHRGREFARG